MLSYHGSMRPRNAANSPSSECLDAADVCEQGVGADVSGPLWHFLPARWGVGGAGPQVPVLDKLALGMGQIIQALRTWISVPREDGSHS